MLQVTADQVVAALQATGVQPGDGVLVHSAIQYLGQTEGGVGMYYTSLCRALDIRIGLNPGDPGSGTLVVPAFNFAFARGEPFDPQTTPSAGMGASQRVPPPAPGGAPHAAPHAVAGGGGTLRGRPG